MARIDRQAAKIVALHDRVSKWPSAEPGINEAFLQFLEAWMPQCEGTTLYLQIPKGATAYPRPFHIFAEYDAAKGAVLVTLEINDTYRNTTTPNTEESLRKAALTGDTGRLAEDGIWFDPRLQGALMMFVQWGNDKLWKHCASSGRRASRLAYEALAGRSWEEQFGKPGLPTEQDRINAIRDEAKELFDELTKRPYAIPLRVLRNRGDLSMTQAIAAYLIEESGLSWQDAAAATGTEQWRTLYSALRDRDLKRTGRSRSGPTKASRAS